MDQQNTIILKLQEAVHSLTENISKLQSIQEMQEQKIRILEREDMRNDNKNKYKSSKHKHSDEVYKKTIH